MNPGLARALGAMLKQDFQQAVLNRIPRMNAARSRPLHSVALVCDEYQPFATTARDRSRFPFAARFELGDDGVILMGSPPPPYRNPKRLGGVGSARVLLILWTGYETSGPA